MRQDKAKTDDRSRVPKHSSQWGKTVPYAVMSLVSVICGLAVLVLLVWQADRLAALGMTGYVYYIVLVLIGLGVAGFLFKVCRSYGRYRGEQLGGTLGACPTI